MWNRISSMLNKIKRKWGFRWVTRVRDRISSTFNKFKHYRDFAGVTLITVTLQQNFSRCKSWLPGICGFGTRTLRKDKGPSHVPQVLQLLTAF